MDGNIEDRIMQPFLLQPVCPARPEPLSSVLGDTVRDGPRELARLVSLLCLELLGNSQPAKTGARRWRERRKGKRLQSGKSKRESGPGKPTRAAQVTPRGTVH